MLKMIEFVQVMGAEQGRLSRPAPGADLLRTAVAQAGVEAPLVGPLAQVPSFGGASPRRV